MKRLGTDATLASAIVGSAVVLIWSGLQLGIPTASLYTRSYSALLSGAAVILGLAIVAWWLFGLCAACLGLLLQKFGHSKLAALPLAVSPAFMKRLAAATLGINLLAVPLAAQASETHAVPASISSIGTDSVSPYFPIAAGAGSGSADGSAVPYGTRPLIDPSWKPSAPPASPGLIARQVTGPSQQDAEVRTVTVMAGDSLWEIAARDLGRLATDSDIAGHWPKWYAANKDTIGDDPRRLLPGQILAAPTD